MRLRPSPIPQARRRRSALLLLFPALLVLALPLVVREVSRREQALHADQRAGSRAVTYELSPGAALDYRVGAATSGLRFVLHAFRHASLDSTPHTARLAVTRAGMSGPVREEFVLALPGSGGRARAESGELVVGDPLALSLDVDAPSGGGIGIALAGVDGADGVLVRAYERLNGDVAETNAPRLSGAAKQLLALRAGEPDWDDLEPFQRDSAADLKWHRLAPSLRSETSARARTLVLSPRPPAPPPDPGRAVTRLALLPGEGASGTASGPNRLWFRAGPGETAELRLRVRSKGSERVLRGRSAIELGLDEDECAEFEVTSDAKVTMALRALSPRAISLGRVATYYRVTQERPALVASDTEPLVLRVTARVPLSREAPAASKLTLTATITTSGVTTTSEFVEDVAPAPFDRYDALVTVRPSERAHFYLVLPPKSHAELRPKAGGPVDLLLSELDPAAPPRHEREPEPACGGDAPSLDGRGGEFSPRRPSNFTAFGPDARIELRASPPLDPVVAVPGSFDEPRVRRPRSSASKRVGRARFEPATLRFQIETRAGHAALVNLRFFALAPAEIVAHVDGDAPRRGSGVARHVTLSRRVRIDGETKASLVLGEDLAPGAHTLWFSGDGLAEVWVHLPWLRRPHGKRRDTGWIAGDFQ